MLINRLLTEMKAIQESNLPETAYIQAFQTVSDGAGGYDKAWVTIATVKARIGEPKGEMEKQVAAQMKSGVAYMVTLPASTQVDPANQIQINGTQYEVHWMNKKKSYLTALRVMVTEVQTP